LPTSPELFAIHQVTNLDKYIVRGSHVHKAIPLLVTLDLANNDALEELSSIQDTAARGKLALAARELEWLEQEENGIREQNARILAQNEQYM
jgi:hypothetical protein